MFISFSLILIIFSSVIILTISLLFLVTI